MARPVKHTNRTINQKLKSVVSQAGSGDRPERKYAKRLLFVMLTTLADKAGRFEWRPSAMAGVVGIDKDCDIEDLLNGLVEENLVERYTVAGEDFGQINGWENLQRTRAEEPTSHLPSPAQKDATSKIENAQKPDFESESFNVLSNSNSNLIRYRRDINVTIDSELNTNTKGGISNQRKECTSYIQKKVHQDVENDAVDMFGNKPFTRSKLASRPNYHAIIDLYNDLVGSMEGMPMAQSPGKSIMRLIDERWDDMVGDMNFKMAEFRRTFSIVSETDGLIGIEYSSSRKPFKASIGWILQVDKWDRIRNGYYDFMKNKTKSIYERIDDGEFD